LGDAARDVGFFYLVGHRIDEMLIDSIVVATRRFFTLPERDKLTIEMALSPHFRGYTRPGSKRTRGRAGWREQIDIGAERPALRPVPGLRPGRGCKVPTNGRRHYRI
jgi:isopenicillin N synthase-like dioxygenase